MPLFDAEGRLSTDPCAVRTRDQDNEGIATYHMTNLRPDGGACCSKVPRDPLMGVAVKHRNLTPWTGYGWNTCGVDEDSKLRISSRGTHPRTRQQLAKRVFEAAPDLTHGALASDDSTLREGINMAPLRDCTHLSEQDYRRFTPGVCPVGIEHIVPTMWVNGGASSREIARSDTFLKSMGYRRVGGVWRRVC